MSLADYPNQFTVFCNNLYTKLMVDKRVWRIKRWEINENSLYTDHSPYSFLVNQVYTHLILSGSSFCSIQDRSKLGSWTEMS